MTKIEALPDRLPAVLVEPTAQGIDHEIIGIAMLIANDVIPFDRHHAFWRWPSGVEGRWHYRTGLIDAADFPFQSRINKYRRVFTQLSNSVPSSNFANNSPTSQEHEKSECACHAFVRLHHGIRGYIAIKRPKPFSVIEEYHLGLVAQLIEGAHRSDAIRDLLHRLHFALVDDRTLMQASKPVVILRKYLAKALAVCHAEFSQPRALIPKKPRSPAIRTTAKLITSNRTALRIAACDSTRPGEWTQKHRATKYFLTDPGDSVAAIVYQTQRPRWTNAYLTIVPNKPLFHDTKCHISVPIVAGSLRSMGVLSIETNASDSYSEILASAFCLLAAHAAWPLERSLNRDGAEHQQREIRLLASIVTQFQRTRNLQELLKLLMASLAKLGFSRGIICSVSADGERVNGVDWWGDKLMKEVMEWTRRVASTDSGDCQILAVKRAQPVLIRNPQDRQDPRVNRDAYVAGNLKPFGIFPVFDNHGRPIYTVHVEREDGVPLGAKDVKLVQEVCAGMVGALERRLHESVGDEWLKTIIANTTVSNAELFARFARHVCDKGLAARCRVFSIDENHQQVGICQAGICPYKRFKGFKLNSRCRRFADLLRREKKPLLVQKKIMSQPSLIGVGKDFGLEIVSRAEHVEEFHKQSTSEWVEAPVFLDGKLIAKVVLDHKGRKLDRFTSSEMQLIATLSNQLSLGVEAVSNQALRSSLCAEGAVTSIVRHRLFRCKESIKGLSTKGLSGSKLRIALKALESSLQQLDEMFSREKRSRSLTLAKDVGNAVRLIRDWLGNIQLKVHPARLPKKDLTGTNHALCLILLVLLENAIDAVKADNSAKKPIEIAIAEDSPANETSGQSETRIRVVDHGIGVNSDIAATFDKPARYLGRRPSRRTVGQGRGLAYARALAHELGWRLILTQQKKPTVFDLILNV